MKGHYFARSSAMGLIAGITLFLVVMFGLTACQGTEPAPAPAPSPSPEPSPAPTATVVEVEVSNFKFVPETVTVSPGTTVTWTNADSAPHTATSREDVFDSGSMSKGDTFSYTFGQTGTNQYYCTIHPYMEGTVIVE